MAPGQQVKLVVQGVRSTSFDGDDFRFEWSTNGTTFTPVPMDSLPTIDLDDGVPRIGDLPSTLAGTVTLRIVDTNRAAGSQFLDWLRIDSLLVRSTTP